MIEFPAIYRKQTVLARILEVRRVESVKASLAIGKWNAQYQQNPTAEEEVSLNENGGTYGTKTSPAVSRDQSYDTAFLKKKLQIIRRLQRGVCSIRPRTADRISFC